MALPRGVREGLMLLFWIRLALALWIGFSSAAAGAILFGIANPSYEVAYLVYSANRHLLYIADVNHAFGYRLANAPLAETDYRWSPDGLYVAFTSSVARSTEVFIARADGRSLRQLTVTDDWEYSPAWSPDGQYLVFSRQAINAPQSRELIVMNVADRSERILTHNDETELFPLWSPDGRQIAYVVDGQPSDAIKVIDAETGVLQAEVNEIAGDFHEVTWSPDSTRLLFDVFNRVNNIIYVMDVRSAQIHPLNHALNTGYEPHWSPDGRHVVFLSNDSSNPEIYVMDDTGENQVQLTYTLNVMESWPVWSPDGGRLAFAVYDGAGNDIYVMNADGSGLQRVTATLELIEMYPRWRP
ncbi:MAG: hypothetical protein U0694_10900 [Anaerolineae bacterium]